jgi:hypothetical protein
VLAHVCHGVWGPGLTREQPLERVTRQPLVALATCPSLHANARTYPARGVGVFFPRATEAVRSEMCGLGFESLQSHSCCRFEFGCAKAPRLRSAPAAINPRSSCQFESPPVFRFLRGEVTWDNVSLFFKKKENNISLFGLVERITYFR